MKNLYKIFLGLVLALATTVSCTEVEVEEQVLSTQEAIGTFRVMAGMPSSDTKVDVDGFTVAWNESDEIAIAEVGDNGEFVTSYTYSIDAETISEDGKYAEFVGANLTAGKSYIAYNYAYTGYLSTWSQCGITKNFFCVYDYSYFDHNNVDLMMQSNIFEYDGQSLPQLYFKHKSSLLEMEIELESGSEYEGEIESISISSGSTVAFLTDLIFDSYGQSVYAFYISSGEQADASSSIELELTQSVEFGANSPVSIKVPLTWNGYVAEAEGDFSFTIKTTDGKVSTVTKPMQILEDGVHYTAELTFSEPLSMVDMDRAALIDLYNSTDGDNWTDNTNWCTDADLSEWYGVTTDSDGRVSQLDCFKNNLVGSIPESIGNLTNLTSLSFQTNSLSGSIPESIWNLTKLQSLSLGANYQLSGSIPESIGNLENLLMLKIFNTLLSGTIPESIGNLTKLTHLYLYFNQLTGSIPESIGNISSLLYAGLNYNQLSGSIPESIGNLTKLKYLWLENNQLTGSIPESIIKLENLESFFIYYNNLSGEIAEHYSDYKMWSFTAWYLGQNEGYGFTSFPDIYIEPSTVTTIENKTINTEDFFDDNELTCVIYWGTWCWYGTYYMETIKDLYNSYASKGFGLISLLYEDLSTITEYVTDNNIPGHVCQVLDPYVYDDGTNRVKYLPIETSPIYAFVDSSGKIVFSEYLYAFDNPTMSREEATIAFLEEYFGEPATGGDDDDDLYESIDYSRDGEVVTLQTATVGDGIDLVIVGDGFIDSDMASGGTYESRMNEAMEHFFSEEPYTTYRDRYNVYTVKAVSKHEGVNGVSETAFSAEFGDEATISGDDSTVFEYALKVPSISTTNNLTVLAVLKSSKYAGTCYMYTNDASISYCPIVSFDDEQFRQIITHECGGHGFAKLLDEYAYSGTIPDDEIEGFEWTKSIGWGANVDVTSDPDTIQWSHMLSDSHYEGLVGIYEGALTYTSGAYRPTDVSIMRYNTGGYNPPSREEIYRRIMVLSGEDYDYEEFVAYDAINRSISAQAANAAKTRSFDSSSFTPLAQPVIIRNAPNVKK